MVWGDVSLMQEMTGLVWNGGMPPSHSPEVAKVVEHGLFVKCVLGNVYNNGAVNKVADPVGSPFRVQGEVPVHPANHVVEEVLQYGQG